VPPVQRPRSRLRPVPVGQVDGGPRGGGLPDDRLPQTMARLGPATAGLYQALLENQVTHDGDTRLARHVAQLHAPHRLARLPHREGTGALRASHRPRRRRRHGALAGRRDRPTAEALDLRRLTYRVVKQGVAACSRLIGSRCPRGPRRDCRRPAAPTHAQAETRSGAPTRPACRSPRKCTCRLFRVVFLGTCHDHREGLAHRRVKTDVTETDEGIRNGELERG